jgi:hypothetical protein
MEDHRCGHLQLLQRIGRGLQVTARQMEIHRGVRKIGVAEEYLDRPQVSAGFQQMRRVRVAPIFPAT